MSQRVWKKGPPPHIGWWNASRYRYEEMWRWWDGVRWSGAVEESQSPKSAAADAVRPATNDVLDVEWTSYWPENARVPRVAPC